MKERNACSPYEEAKFRRALYQRYHNSHYRTDEERKETQRTSALMFYWRKKLFDKYYIQRRMKMKEIEIELTLNLMMMILILMKMNMK